VPLPLPLPLRLMRCEGLDAMYAAMLGRQLIKSTHADNNGASAKASGTIRNTLQTKSYKLQRDGPQGHHSKGKRNAASSDSEAHQ
jgi:hypothetical protein